MPKTDPFSTGETALITDVLLPIAGPREWHENLSVLMRQIYQEVLQAHRVGRRGVGQARLLEVAGSGNQKLVCAMRAVLEASAINRVG